MLRLAAQPLVPGLADAHDRSQLMPKRGGRFFSDHHIGLCEVPAPFGMPHDHVTAAKIPQHGTRNFSGKGALIFPVEILRAQEVRTAFDFLRDGGKRCKRRRQDGDRDARSVVAKDASQLLDQLCRFGNGLVHLPVADNQGRPLEHARLFLYEGYAGRRSGRAAMPGSTLPSSNSSAAPPPVEMKDMLSETPARWTPNAVSAPPTMVSA